MWKCVRWSMGLLITAADSLATSSWRRLFSHAICNDPAHVRKVASLRPRWGISWHGCWAGHTHSLSPISRGQLCHSQAMQPNLKRDRTSILRASLLSPSVAPSMQPRGPMSRRGPRHTCRGPSVASPFLPSWPSHETPNAYPLSWHCSLVSAHGPCNKQVSDICKRSFHHIISHVG